jgi:hypothetical protein
MELLIIKTGKAYIRVKEGAYLTVGLDKASVFPTDLLDTVMAHAQSLREKGFLAVDIKRLILTEEDL